MRILYGLIIAVICIASVIGFQTWRGPELPALKVAIQALELRILASGEVRYQSVARIGSQITGTVVTRHVREGDWVNKGDLLIELNAYDLQSRLAQAITMLQQLQDIIRPQAQASLEEAYENLNQASREARRRETLAKQGMITAEQVEQAQRLEQTAKTTFTRAKLAADSLAKGGSDERLLEQRIESAEAEIAKTKLYAPFSGRIQTRNVEPGDIVQPTKILFELARSDAQACPSKRCEWLEVVVALDEKNFSPIKLNQSVSLIADAWPELSIPGKVSFIAPAVDSARGTVDIHISILNTDSTNRPTLLQGMTVSANILAAKKDKALVIPNDYLLFNTNGQAQVLRWQQGEVNAVDVSFGLQNMTHSEITSGLNEGDIVVQAQRSNIGQPARIRFEQVDYVIR